MQGARQTRIIAFSAATQFKGDCLTIFKHRVSPHRVGCCRCLTSQNQWMYRCHIAAKFIRASNLRGNNIRHQITLAHPRVGAIKGCLHRQFSDFRRRLQHFDFRIAFHQTHPVDQQIGIMPCGIGQAGPQCR